MARFNKKSRDPTTSARRSQRLAALSNRPKPEPRPSRPPLQLDQKGLEQLADPVSSFKTEIKHATTELLRAAVFARYRDRIIRKVASQGAWSNKEFTQFMHLLDRLGVNEGFCSRVLEIVYDKDESIKKLALIQLSKLDISDLKTRLGVTVEPAVPASNILPTLKSRLSHGSYRITKENFFSMDTAIYDCYQSHYGSLSEQTAVALTDSCFQSLFTAIRNENHFCVSKELGLSTLKHDRHPVEIRNTVLTSGRPISYHIFLTGSVDYSIIVPTPPLSIIHNQKEPMCALSIESLRHVLTRTCEQYHKADYEDFNKALKDGCEGITQHLKLLFQLWSDFIPRKISTSPPGIMSTDYNICLVECKRTDLHSHEEYEQSFFKSVDEIVTEIDKWKPLAQLDFPDTGFAVTPDPLTTTKAKEIFEKISKDTKVERTPTVNKDMKPGGKGAKAQFLTDHLGQVVGQCLTLHIKSKQEEGIYKFILATGIHWTWGTLKCTADGKRICKHTKVIAIPFKLRPKIEEILTELRLDGCTNSESGEAARQGCVIEVVGFRNGTNERRDPVGVEDDDYDDGEGSDEDEQEVEDMLLGLNIESARGKSILERVQEDDKRRQKYLHNVTLFNITWITSPPSDLDDLLSEGSVSQVAGEDDSFGC